MDIQGTPIIILLNIIGFDVDFSLMQQSISFLFSIYAILFMLTILVMLDMLAIVAMFYQKYNLEI